MEQILGIMLDNITQGVYVSNQLGIAALFQTNDYIWNRFP